MGDGGRRNKKGDPSEHVKTGRFIYLSYIDQESNNLWRPSQENLSSSVNLSMTLYLMKNMSLN